MTLGEFRKITNHLADEVEILTTSDDCETKGYIIKADTIRIMKFRKEKQNLTDDIDGTPYSLDIYMQYDYGKEMIFV